MGMEFRFEMKIWHFEFCNRDSSVFSNNPIYVHEVLRNLKILMTPCHLPSSLTKILGDIGI